MIDLISEIEIQTEKQKYVEKSIEKFNSELKCIRNTIVPFYVEDELSIYKEIVELSFYMLQQLENLSLESLFELGELKQTVWFIKDKNFKYMCLEYEDLDILVYFTGKFGIRYRDRNLQANNIAQLCSILEVVLND